MAAGAVECESSGALPPPGLKAMNLGRERPIQPTVRVGGTFSP
jgi:hypothetical protein